MKYKTGKSGLKVLVGFLLLLSGLVGLSTTGIYGEETKADLSPGTINDTEPSGYNNSSVDENEGENTNITEKGNSTIESVKIINNSSKANRTDNKTGFDRSEQGGRTHDNEIASGSTEIGIAVEKTVYFNAGPSKGNIESYSWDFGDGTEGSGRKVSHSYRPGNYSVKLTVTDSEGNKDSFQKNIRVGR